MRRLLSICSMILLFFVYTGSLPGQDYDLEGSYPKYIGPFHPSLIHANHPYNRAQSTPGWIITIQYPGFSSFSGEYSLGRTTKSGNSFSLGVGWMYFLTQIDIKLKQTRSGSLYLNFAAGNIPFYPMKTFIHLGSVGISYIYAVSPSIEIQSSFDGIFHDGTIRQIIIQDTPATYGIQWNNEVQRQISDSFHLSASLGIAYFAYRYYIIGDDVFYTDWRNNLADTGRNFQWQDHISLLLNVSVQYQF